MQFLAEPEQPRMARPNFPLSPTTVVGVAVTENSPFKTRELFCHWSRSCAPMYHSECCGWPDKTSFPLRFLSDFFHFCLVYLCPVSRFPCSLHNLAFCTRVLFCPSLVREFRYMSLPKVISSYPLPIKPYVVVLAKCFPNMLFFRRRKTVATAGRSYSEAAGTTPFQMTPIFRKRPTLTQTVVSKQTNEAFVQESPHEHQEGG